MNISTWLRNATKQLRDIGIADQPTPETGATRRSTKDAHRPPHTLQP